MLDLPAWRPTKVLRGLSQSTYQLTLYRDLPNLQKGRERKRREERRGEQSGAADRT
jgi:hypothetical protein